MKHEAAGRRILIIEDALDLLGLMKSALEREGYLVFCAANGADGIACHARERPELIILDLYMPIMGGIEALQTIRRTDDKVLVVILTSYPTPDTIRDAADLNVSEYLSKPFECRDLVKVIDTVFAHKIS
jgi:DNA-binding response OmpR family regulator